MNIKLLRSLCETPGVPGREERVRALIEKEIKGLFDEVRTDPMGSLICTLAATSRDRKGAGSAPGRQTAPSRSRLAPRIMIAAHMDEIGFYIRHIDDHGFLWVNAAGGFDTRNLFSRRVLVCGEKKDFPGVMNPGGKPIHISSPEDRKKVPEVEEFFIDLGMKPDDVKRQIKIGDFVVLDAPFLEQPTKVVSKALDNRVACFIAIEAVRKAFGSRPSAIGKKGAAKADSRRPKAGSPSADLIVVFTVQEEVGLRGATAAANAVGADIGIGLDTTLACDTPGVPDNQRVTKHGEGVGIMVQDSSMIADHTLIAELCAVAEKRKIPYQRCILPRGGQDGAAIQKSGPGARTAAIVCGTRYIHTVTESIDKKDLQATIDLLAAWMGEQ